jgi:hypothetical protein
MAMACSVFKVWILSSFNDGRPSTLLDSRVSKERATQKAKRFG